MLGVVVIGIIIAAAVLGLYWRVHGMVSPAVKAEAMDLSSRWTVLHFTERISEQRTVDPRRSSKFPLITSWVMLGENRCVYRLTFPPVYGVVGLATRDGDEVHVEVKIKPWIVISMILFGVFIGVAMIWGRIIDEGADAAAIMVYGACFTTLMLGAMAIAWVVMLLQWSTMFRAGCKEIIRFQWGASASDGDA